jgi:phosphoserine phosphatase
VAYGNAASDLPHLLLADEPRLVNPDAAARRAAARRGLLPYADWRDA